MTPVRPEETFDGCLIAVANGHARTAIERVRRPARIGEYMMTSRELRRICDLRKLGRLANMRQLGRRTRRWIGCTDAVALPRSLCDLSDNGGPDESYPSMDSSSLPVLRFNCRFCRKTARRHGDQFLGWVQRSLVWAELRQQHCLQPFVLLP